MLAKDGIYTGKTGSCQNGSTCLNTNSELDHFRLIAG